MSEYKRPITDATANSTGDQFKTMVSKEEYMTTGFMGYGGLNRAVPPSILWANGDFRTINISWKPFKMMNNLDHYAIQCSEDQNTWGELICDGSGVVGDNGSSTHVWAMNIAHTHIPFNNGAVRNVYYRVASVTKAGDQSGWSGIVQGNTYFLEISDDRDGYVYNGFGIITVSCDDVTTNRYQGPNTYVGGGSITVSGAAITGYNVEYTASGSIIITGIATTTPPPNWLFTNDQGQGPLTIIINGISTGVPIDASFNYQWDQGDAPSGDTVYAMYLNGWLSREAG